MKTAVKKEVVFSVSIWALAIGLFATGIYLTPEDTLKPNKGEFIKQLNIDNLEYVFTCKQREFADSTEKEAWDSIQNDFKNAVQPSERERILREMLECYEYVEAGDRVSVRRIGTVHK